MQDHIEQIGINNELINEIFGYCEKLTIEVDLTDIKQDENIFGWSLYGITCSPCIDQEFEILSSFIQKIDAKNFIVFYDQKWQLDKINEIMEIYKISKINTFFLPDNLRHCNLFKSQSTYFVYTTKREISMIFHPNNMILEMSRSYLEYINKKFFNAN